ncbi:hypothetical protein EK21DRAFT_116550 [Setomelanomma holmii]|uniref:NACHT domain-containing protein n=1 Tax=Setomelanomma holmii TaxID=210430 RepID=A0A9P4LHY6_9PLEO|nr:hypothetical protein EK21DRAFT_116550 [Setomelanomma holmii]
MEAVAALGIAGNTVQFLDFASKLCVTSFEIYRNADGASASNSQAKLLLQSFVDTIDQVSNDLSQYFNALGAASTKALQQNDAQTALIISDCQSIAKDLSSRYEKLKASSKPGKWKSFAIGLKCVWKKNELEELQKRLKKLRDELEWRIMISLREGLNLLASRQEDQFRDLQASVVAKLTVVIRDQISDLPRWPDHVDDAMQHLRAVVHANPTPGLQHESQAGVVTTCSLPVRTLPKPAPQSFADEYAEDCAAKLAEIEEDRWKSLHFHMMDDREEQIATAELRTFEWILEPPQDKVNKWSNFIEWLETGESIYWINGKAGAGKSTIMKYLNNHPKIKTALKKWAADTPLVTATFYFWYNGNALQKTQEGLLRSLLYQALNNHRELIPVVLKGAFDVPKDDLITFWTLPRLKVAFKRLVEQQDVPLRICLFVDGLDEYAGDLAEITKIFQDAAKFKHVKLCVSSRPLIVFDRAFKFCPGLMLQHLTFDDVQIYVRRRFNSDDRFQELEVEEPGLGPHLALQVVLKASGVFLWVKLVVHSLLEGIQNFDRGVDLERRLHDLPYDLHDLYRHMLDRVKPVWYLEQGFRLLLLVRSSHTPITLLRLAFTELPLAEADGDLWDLTIERQTPLCRSMAGRIKSRCLGLLEVVESSEARNTDVQVQFLHKSVADFIDTPEMKIKMQKCLGSFGRSRARMLILQAIFTELKTTWSRLDEDDFGDEGELKRKAFFDEVHPRNVEAHAYANLLADEDNIPRNQNSLLDAIDWVTDDLWNTVTFRHAGENWRTAPRLMDVRTPAPKHEDLMSLVSFAKMPKGTVEYIPWKLPEESEQDDLLEVGTKFDAYGRLKLQYRDREQDADCQKRHEQLASVP